MFVYAGLNYLMRKMAGTFKPTMDISVDGDTIKVVTKTPKGPEIKEFKLDADFESEDKPTGEKMKVWNILFCTNI